MLEEQKEHEDRRSSITEFHNEFYAAIMDEDLEQMEAVSKKQGINSVIQIQDGALRKFFSKGFGVLPLHLAASYRRVKSMQSLLSLGADPEIRDRIGRTTLHLVIASWPRTLTTCSKEDSKFGTSASGPHRNAQACLQLLCEHGVNINAKVDGGSQETALHLSVRYTALSAVQALTSHGANVNAMDNSGMTPLHMAAGILHKDIISHLLSQGADIAMGVMHTGNTALHLAALAAAMKTSKTLEDDFSCISELLEHGAEPDAENKAGVTPLQQACSMGNEGIVDVLLRYGADINKLNNAGENCLFLFLDHRPNVSNSSLLVKLLSLTSPLTIYNKDGHLPSTLTLPHFCKQRETLLKLTRQPRRLQDICKGYIYRKHIRSKKEALEKMLPERLYDFVFNYWENIHNISFVTGDEQDSFSNPVDITPS